MRKPVKQISRHGLTIGIKHYADGRYGFDSKDEHGKEVLTRKKSLDDAEAAALEMLEAGAAGSVDLKRIDRDDYLQFLQWRAARGVARLVPELVAEFLDEKERDHLSYWTLRDYRGTLNLFADAFPGHLSGVTRRQALHWLALRNIGPRRFNNMLAVLKSLCVWARNNRILTAELHDIETICPKKIRTVIKIYTVEQMKALLEKVEPEWLPVIALGAFTGIRPEEVCPDPVTDKPGMVWGDIDFRRGKVIVRAEVAKTRKKRMVPMNDAIRSFLDHPGKPNEPIAPSGRAFHNQMRRWPKPWIKDGLRHSYASYRLAITQDAPALSLEMGNSVAVCMAHYADIVFPEAGEEWFAIRKNG